MLDDLPAALALTISIGKARLRLATILEGKGINPGVNRNRSLHANIGLIDRSFWPLSEEMHKVILNLRMVMTHLIRERRQQNRIWFIESGYYFRISGLERLVPLLKKLSYFLMTDFAQYDSPSST